jgi:ribosomal peptide maturation radical SAM protein 1
MPKKTKLASGSQKSAAKVALISTPWALFDRPSIQLGSLKAYLKSLFPDLHVEAHHFFLKLADTIGYQLYQEISKRTWLAESIYAALLHPEAFQRSERLFLREAGRKKILTEVDFKGLTTRVKKATDTFIHNHNWNEYMLVGFSVSLCQLTSALYFIKHIKARWIHATMAVGGAAVSGGTAAGLLEICPELDIVVTGEGELPLQHLIAHLKDSCNLGALPPLPGISRQSHSDQTDSRPAFSQMNTLERLPVPDYDDYFKLMATLHPRHVFFPILPVESSRGCWWQRKTGAGHTSGCAFCNLNLQWDGYRAKTPSQVVAEIDSLTSKHKLLSVSFVDNVLPKKTTHAIFKKLAGCNKDLHLFCEIRATTAWRELKTMRAAGMQEVQIGIEALSSRLLGKLHKGTSVLQNLEIMRNCEALGLVNRSNLIIHFPGSDAQDVAETLRTIEFALPFRPLQAVEFWLGLGSPVWQRPHAFGLNAVCNHPKWAFLFPSGIVKSVRFSIQSYRGNLRYQKKIWRPVIKKIKLWQKSYAELQRDPFPTPILSFRDGRDFLIIKQRRVLADPLNHRLTGTSRQIYLFCRRPRSLKRIRERFSSFSEDKLVVFLKTMVDKKLMFAENDRYLSLAVPIRPENFY